MKRALAPWAAAAVLGLAGIASAAPVTILDDGQGSINNWGAGWAQAVWSTSAAHTGNYGVQLVATGQYVQYTVALDTPVAVDSVDPNSASLSFDYQVIGRDPGTAFPATLNLSLGLCEGYWNGNSANLRAATDVISDGAWHTGTVQFQGWAGTAPAAGTLMDNVNIEKGVNYWSPETMTLNIDHLVFTSPVPEPATFGLLAGAGLLALRRRRA